MMESMKDEFYKAFSHLNFNDMLIYTDFSTENKTNTSTNISSSLNLEDLNNIYLQNDI